MLTPWRPYGDAWKGFPGLLARFELCVPGLPSFQGTQDTQCSAIEQVVRLSCHHTRREFSFFNCLPIFASLASTPHSSTYSTLHTHKGFKSKFTEGSHKLIN